MCKSEKRFEIKRSYVSLRFKIVKREFKRINDCRLAGVTVFTRTKDEVIPRGCEKKIPLSKTVNRYSDFV